MQPSHIIKISSPIQERKKKKVFSPFFCHSHLSTILYCDTVNIAQEFPTNFSFFYKPLVFVVECRVVRNLNEGKLAGRGELVWIAKKIYIYAIKAGKISPFSESPSLKPRKTWKFLFFNNFIENSQLIITPYLVYIAFKCKR